MAHFHASIYMNKTQESCVHKMAFQDLPMVQVTCPRDNAFIF